MGEFVPPYHVTVWLAYDPPSHRKYNPLARGWGILANHGHSSLLAAIDAGLQCAATMTWKPPIVPRVTTTYETEGTLTADFRRAKSAHNSHRAPQRFSRNLVAFCEVFFRPMG